MALTDGTQVAAVTMTTSSLSASTNVLVATNLHFSCTCAAGKSTETYQVLIKVDGTQVDQAYTTSTSHNSFDATLSISTVATFASTGTHTITVYVTSGGGGTGALSNRSLSYVALG